MMALRVSEVARRLKHPSVRNLRRQLLRLHKACGGILISHGKSGSAYLVDWSRLRTAAPHMFDLPGEIDSVRRKVDGCLESIEDLKGQNLAISNRLRALSVRLHTYEKRA